MGGFFGTISTKSCVNDLFYGTDYNSHLGTRRAGMVMYDRKDGFQRAIHNIENSPFRTKFDSEVNEMHGNLGIGCISDYDPQPLLVRSHHGTFAIMTVLAFFMLVTAYSLPALLLSLLFLGLVIPYIAHYYFLENSVQKLYKLYYRALDIAKTKQ